MSRLFNAFLPLLYITSFIYRRRVIRNTRIVAVVGSYGKTSTMRALCSILCGGINRYAANGSLFWATHAILRTRPGTPYLVIEAAIMGPGQMKKFARLINPDITVVTSVGHEHRTSFKTLENTRNEKADMVRALASSGLAVLNSDDPHVLWMKTQTKARVVLCGSGKSDDVRLEHMRLDWPPKSRLRISIGDRIFDLETRLVGRPMAYPVLAAIAVALEEGLDMEKTVLELGKLTPTIGRLEPIKLEGGAYLLRDDFKGSVETVETALETLLHIPADRKTIILGEASESPEKDGKLYRRIGAYAASAADRVIFVGGKNRFRLLRSGAEKAGKRRGDLFHVRGDLLKAVEALPDSLGENDLVLVKGRGSQRMDRISLKIMGRDVRCTIKECNAKLTRCHHCGMLTREWKHE